MANIKQRMAITISAYGIIIIMARGYYVAIINDVAMWHYWLMA